MRYRGRKDIPLAELEEVNVLVTPNIINYSDKFKNNKFEEILLELGAGRGTFTLKLAEKNTNSLIVAVEKSKSFAKMLAENVLDHKLENVLIICDDVTNLSNWILDNSISHIYLNFSDPWPKKRHHKRRLTYKTFLDLYNKLLINNKCIQFRTDHFELFTNSLEYIENHEKFVIKSVDFDLPLSDLYTDYEVIKRVNYTINQVIAEKIND